MGRWAQFRARYLRVRRWLLLTDLGVLVLGFGVLVFSGYGLPRSDYVVQLAVGAAIGLVGLALLLVAFGAWLVHRKTRREVGESEPLSFQATRGFAFGRELPRLWGLPLVDVRVECPAPAGLRVEVAQGRERFEALHRTGGDALVRAYRIEDAFGLARLSFQRREPRSVEIAPWLGGLERAPALSALAPGENRAHPLGRPAGDRVEMRPYVRGDPLRMILWKLYARTGSVMVRTAERALDEDTEVHAYLIPDEGDEPSAAAAYAAVTKGLLGPKWRFATDGWPEGTRDPDAAARMIALSRGLGRSGGRDLEGFLNALSTLDSARVVLFVPCRPGEWLKNVTRLMGPFQGRAVGVVAYYAEPSMDAYRRAWLFRAPVRLEEVESRPGQVLLETVGGALKRLGMEVLMLDRVSGRASGTQSPRRVA